jgi:GDP-4-dehydro-6-deoxy-D-mannose reductase
VFGASGFLGKQFVLWAHDLEDVELHFPTHAEVDLTDLSAVEELFSQDTFDIVINFAYHHINDENKEFTSNLAIISNLMRYAENTRIVQIGSAAEYGKQVLMPVRESTTCMPFTAYGCTKLAQTAIAVAGKALVARIFNIIGDCGVYGDFLRQITASNVGQIYVGNINSRRDFLPVEAICRAVWLIACEGKQGEIYNVCSGKSTLISSLLYELIAKSGKSVEVIVKKGLIRNDVENIYGDNTKICALGWTA